MANDKNIYSSLQVILDSDDLQLKPQSQEKDFGAVGQVFSNSVGVAGAYSQEKIKVLFDANDKLGKQVGSRLIQVNFGIFNVLYKKLEQKSNEKIAKELAIEGATGYVVAKSIETGFVIKQVAKETGKKVGIRAGISIAARIFTGIGTGAIAGSEVPIVGTIIGAVAGGIIASKIEDKVFEDEKKEQEKIKEINEEIKKIYSKINRVEFYKSLQSQDTQKDSNNTESKKELQIKPIADSISITLEIEKCYDESNMNKAHTDKLLINKTIYVYNKRFERVVAKTQTDENGKAVFTEVFVGKEHTIDELRFMVDRDNLSERVA